MAAGVFFLFEMALIVIVAIALLIKPGQPAPLTGNVRIFELPEYICAPWVGGL